MSDRTCAYVASKNDPESWHGTDPAAFYLDLSRKRGGLGRTEWHCPHPSIERGDGDHRYCVFHTDPSEVPEDVDESEALRDALDEAGTRPQGDRPEHRGQFVGATFGAVTLSGATLTATDDHDVRFDHARFRAEDEALDFESTTFQTRGERPVSFVETTFRAEGDGSVSFADATFRTEGAGGVRFEDATFRTGGDGYVWFGDATVRTLEGGAVSFEDATFTIYGDGWVWFGDATVRSHGDGDISFEGSTFRTHGDGAVSFADLTVRTGGEGAVSFADATFRTDGESGVSFENATVRPDGTGGVSFENATFRAHGDGTVWFGDATLRNVDLRHADFGAANVSGADITGAALGEANVRDVSVNGSTTCERLSEGYDLDAPGSALPTRVRRLFGRSGFNAQEWDSTARAYNDLKGVFSEHGLVGRARDMHVRERRARSLEAKTGNGWLDRRYLGSLPSRVVTGYGVRVGYLVFWMLVLFLGSTAVYVAGDIDAVEGGVLEIVSYSVLAFTVAPPAIPSGTATQFVMMLETFLGTLFIVLLGYILGNREQF